eukprot:ANDGO_05377.mRNA.1 Protein EI24 homolog
MYQVLELFGYGVFDSLNPLAISHIFYCSPTLRQRFLQCFVLNGLIFLGSLLLSERLVFPFFDAFLASRTDPSHSLFLKTVFSILYNIVWTYPIYTVSFVLNTVWYSDMAVHAFRVNHSSSLNPPPNPNLKPSQLHQRDQRHRESTRQQSGGGLFSYKAFIVRLSEEILRYLSACTFFVQIALAMFIPVIGEYVSLLLLCSFYAYYCFEYKWAQMDWPLGRRTMFFECGFAYFTGFGVPATVATYFFPYFINAALFSFLFPLLIVAAVAADREAWIAEKSRSVPRVRAFQLPSRLNSIIIKLLGIQKKLRKTSASSSTTTAQVTSRPREHAIRFAIQ